MERIWCGAWNLRSRGGCVHIIFLLHIMFVCATGFRIASEMLSAEPGLRGRDARSTRCSGPSPPLARAYLAEAHTDTIRPRHE